MKKNTLPKVICLQYLVWNSTFIQSSRGCNLKKNFNLTYNKLSKLVNTQCTFRKEFLILLLEVMHSMKYFLSIFLLHEFSSILIPLTDSSPNPWPGTGQPDSGGGHDNNCLSVLSHHNGGPDYRWNGKITFKLLSITCID